MNLIFLTHPEFLALNSMDKYSAMLSEGMKKRGHQVQTWTAKPRFFNLIQRGAFKKWLGYIDQYIIFPIELHKHVKACPANTLFIFTDHALGPWVPTLAKRLHVIHCHDFLAQFSAMGQQPANPVSWTGKLYQSFIRRGFTKGENFICVSKKTNADLQRFLKSPHSHVVYNGLHTLFTPLDPFITRKELSKKTGVDLSAGYILHVGGNQWYKNRKGVIEIYNAWRNNSRIKVPLLLIGKAPSAELFKKYKDSEFKKDIYFIEDADDQFVQMAYSGASLFLFPSLMEGFGWPIAEAMACGSLVMTTNAPPMSEVAGSAAFFIQPIMDNTNRQSWAEDAAKIINKIFALSSVERQSAVRAGIKNAERFSLKSALNQVEIIYKNIVERK